MTRFANSKLQPFHAMEILGRAKALEAAGRDIAHLEVGEPGVPPAPRVLEAVRAALPEAQRYTHSKGQMELRLALAEYYRAQHGVEVDPELIVATMGSSSGFILAFLGAFEPGARIAVTRPGYPAYLNALDGLNFQAVEIPVTAEGAWRLSATDIEAAHARERFDGLLFASPANPTGAAVTREGLAEIVEVCARLGIRLICDARAQGEDYASLAEMVSRESRTLVMCIEQLIQIAKSPAGTATAARPR